MIKKMITMVTCISMLLCMFHSTNYAFEDAERVLIYVSPDGDNRGAGTIDDPLATIIAARDKIRELKKNGANPQKGFVVYLRGGEYRVTQTLELTEKDSGTEQAPIVYRAYPNETVVMVGGAKLPGNRFTKVTDQNVLDRIVDSNARDKIYEINLSSLGIKGIGKQYWVGTYTYEFKWIKEEEKPKVYGSEVFFDSAALTVARYPNNNFMRVGEVIDPGWDFEKPDNAPQDAPFTIRVEEPRIKYWTEAEDLLAFGFWRFDWADQTVPITEINAGKGTLKSGMPSAFCVIKDRPFYVYNLIEELDSPGEYYIDREKGILYLYPPSDITKADINMSVFDNYGIEIKGASYINIKNINFKAFRNSAINMDAGSYNIISNCELSQTASFAIKMGDNLRNSGVTDCYIHDVNGGIFLNGGDMPTLERGNNYAINNHVKDFARINKTYRSAITSKGVGNLISNNEIHGADHLAILFDGCFNKIYYNEIYDVCRHTDDAGAVYGGQTYVDRGLEIKYNYIHDIVKGQGGLNTAAVYLDGGQCEVAIVGNVVENVVRGFWVNGGRDNLVFNNIAINSGSLIYMTDLLVTDTYSAKWILEKYEKTPYAKSEIWQKAFPKMAEMFALGSIPGEPLGNVCRNNLSVRTDTASYYGQGEKYLDLANNYVTTKDPGFYDWKNRNYMLKEDAGILEKIEGFVPVPFTRMGRFTDRASTRINNAVVLNIGSPYSLINGKKVNIDNDNLSVVPKIIEDTTYVPLRFIAETLGAEVNFNADTKKIDITTPDVSLSLLVDSKNAAKNGEAFEMQKNAVVNEGRTLVPLREISNMFGKKVFWHNKGFIVISDTDDIFDTETDSDDYLISHLYERINIY